MTDNKVDQQQQGVPFGSGMFQGQAKFVDYAHMNQQEVQTNTLDEPVFDTLVFQNSTIDERHQHDTIQIIICDYTENERNTRQKIAKLGLMGTIIIIALIGYVLISNIKGHQELIRINHVNSYQIFQADAIFGTIFIIMWGGSAIITINAKLLGGQVSFFQSVCVLGYCVFPINVAAILITFLHSYLGFFLRLIIVGVAFFWSTMSSLSFMSSMMNEEKKVISVYPIFLFYLFLSWFCIFI